MSGWECPKCHKVYAPVVRECGPCNGQTTTSPVQPVWIVLPQWPWNRPWWDGQTWCSSGASSGAYTFTTTTPGVTDGAVSDEMKAYLSDASLRQKMTSL